MTEFTKEEKEKFSEILDEIISETKMMCPEPEQLELLDDIENTLNRKMKKS